MIDRSLIEDMIKTPFKKTHHCQMYDTGWKDAIEKLKTIEDSRLYKSHNGTTRADYIGRRLGHITVNPHRPYNTQALKECYVCLDECEQELTAFDDRYINTSHERIRSFVEDLVERARNARRMLLHTNEVDRTDRANASAKNFHLILFGPKGAGKTFLLNHILAKYSDYFDQEHILWVRINLVERFGGDIATDFKFDLRHRILAQATKIVMRYYDPISEYAKPSKKYPLRVVETLYEAVKEEAPDTDTANRWTDQVSSMKNAFCKLGSDPSISPDLVPRHLGEIVMRFIFQKGYSVICVLDGLDKLEASVAETRRFERLFDAAVNLTTSTGSQGMMMVSVTRTDTLNTLPNIARHANPFVSGETQRLRIHPVNLNALVDRRLSFLREMVPVIAAQEGWTTEDWPNHIDEFVRALNSEQKNDFTEVLLYTLGDNRRAQTQALQLIYYHYLEKAKLTRYYIPECLALAGQRFPPKVYRYGLTDKGNWRRECVDNSAFDNHLLPSIFHFPYLDRDLCHSQAAEFPHTSGILWGIRLLQILGASDRLFQDRGLAFEPLVAKEASDIMYKLFGYPRSQTLDLIMDFQEFEFLSLKPSDFPVHREPNRLYVQMMPKGLIVLRSFIFDVAYLSLCAMRVPTGGETVTAPFKDNCFIPACLDVAIDMRADWPLSVSQALLQWMAAKIINSTAICRIIIEINNRQQDIYKTKIDSLTHRYRMIVNEAVMGRERMVDGMFQFASRLGKEVIPQLMGMIASLDKEDQRASKELEQIVTAYWSHWC
ncbi:MAG: hypothetical protein WC562_08695 [Dehalococcoidia bacterium]